jgi:hypothetical protein
MNPERGQPGPKCRFRIGHAIQNRALQVSLTDTTERIGRTFALQSRSAARSNEQTTGEVDDAERRE